MTLKSILKNDYVKATGLFLILLCIYYSPVIFSGKTFGSPDSLSPKSSSIALNKAWEETGEFPLWQPWIFSGMPSAEAFSFLSALYFPTIVIKFLFIPGLIAQLLHFLFAGLGGYALMRHLTKDHLLSIFAGAIFMTMPYMTTMIVFGHGSQMMTAAYIPWVFLFTLRILDKPNLSNVGILSILLGLQLQRAHVQIAYYTWMLVGAYVLWFIIQSFREKKETMEIVKPFTYFAISALLAFGIALLIYYPSLGYTEFSIRGGGASGGADYNYATDWSFHPIEILTFFIPSAFGFGGATYWGFMPFTDYPNYMGIIVVLLAVYGAIRYRNTLTYFLSATILLALFISFGKHVSFIYDFFFNYFPYFSKFRVPVMILILVQFNTTLLAAFGLKNIFKDLEIISKYKKYIFIGLGVTGLILLFGDGMIRSMLGSSFSPPRVQDPRAVQAINIMRQEMWIKDAWISLLLIAATFGVLWAFIKESLSKNIVVSSIIILSVLDIGIVNWKIINPASDSGRNSQLISKKMVEQIFQKDETISYLVKDRKVPFRIYPLGQWFGDTRFRAFELEMVGGYHPAKLKNYNTFLTKTNNIGTLPLIRMMNVKYLISPQQLNLQGATFVYQGKMRSSRGYENTFLYEINDALPRSWFVQNVISFDSEQELWSNLTTSSFDPTSVAFARERPDLAQDYTVGEVVSAEYKIHDITLVLRTEKEAFLVMSEVYYPLRWIAQLNEQPIETVEVNGVLRGFVIPPGEHSLTLHYDRSTFYTGISISVISFLISLGFIGFGIMLGRKK